MALDGLPIPGAKTAVTVVIATIEHVDVSTLIYENLHQPPQKWAPHALGGCEAREDPVRRGVGECHGRTHSVRYTNSLHIRSY